MASSRGKEFEALFKKSVESLEVVDITRLYDTTNGYSNIHNPSDFIAYYYPTMWYVECKSICGPRINIKQDLPQLPDLIEKSKRNGVKAGFLIWYIDFKQTYWVSANYVAELNLRGEKSINVKDLQTLNRNDIVLIDAEYKRVYGSYNFTKLFGIN